MSKSELRLDEEYKLKNFLNTTQKLEASGVVEVNGFYYVVFDNFPKIAKLENDLSKKKYSWVNKNGKAPGFEDIAYDEKNKRFYAVVEARKRNGKYQPRVYEFDKDFKFIERNWVEVKFENKNKGLEGLEHITRDGKDYLLGLCEGNKCKGKKKGRVPGGGRIKVLEKAGKNWVKVQTIILPKSLKFVDYASLTLNGNRMAVVSQENSALWVGNLEGISWAVSDDGETYQFPRNSESKKTKYCNVEGACWIGKNKLVVVSDKAKRKQPKRCKSKEQSIHIFEIP